MNILIKLTCLIGLVIAPILGGHTTETDHSENPSEEMMFIDEDGNKTILTDKQAMQVDEAGMTEVKKEIMVKMSVEGDVTNADITIETTKDGETTTETKTFSGTEAEVQAQLDAMKNGDVKVEGKKVIEKVIEEVEKR
jgi:K(+)-stimulated pyrophosphate-energized sodium pump